MTEHRHEHSEHLWITTGVPGDEQEASFRNSTLQSLSGFHERELEFSVAVHVGVPIDVDTEAALHKYLHDVFKVAIDATNAVFGEATLNVEIQLGPEGSGG